MNTIASLLGMNLSGPAFRVTHVANVTDAVTIAGVCALCFVITLVIVCRRSK